MVQWVKVFATKSQFDLQDPHTEKRLLQGVSAVICTPTYLHPCKYKCDTNVKELNCKRPPKQDLLFIVCVCRSVRVSGHGTVVSDRVDALQM